jgi:hypothetical protein
MQDPEFKPKKNQSQDERQSYFYMDLLEPVQKKEFS